MRQQRILAFGLAAAAAFGLACGQTPATPTAPTNASVAGQPDAAADGSTLKVTAPTLVSPAGGIQLEDLDPELVIENAKPLYVASLDLAYVFEVLDQAGQIVYRSDPVAQGSNGRTTHELNRDLEDNKPYRWRARAVLDGRQGPMSATANFETLSRYGVSCAWTGSPIGIIGCRIDQHGGMDHEELIQFMREVAYDLNKLGISDKGGFGLAIKTTGNNCLGYSCDIICEGQGNDQNQYDILLDESIPQWLEVQDVTVRECEIVR